MLTLGTFLSESAAARFAVGLAGSSTLLLLAALAADRLLQDRLRRRAVLTAAFVALLVLPAVHAVGGMWTVGVSTDAPESDVLSRLESEVAVPFETVRSENSVEISEGPIAPNPSRSGVPWAAIWLGGALAVAAYRALGVGAIHGRCRAGRAPSPETCTAVAEIAGQLGLGRRVRAVQSESVSVPAAWILPRATILLPEGFDTWDEPTRRAVVLHELCHLRDRDVEVRILSLLATVLFWAHPLIWMAAARLRIAQEQACDGEVVRAGHDAREYAESLLALARAGRPRRVEIIGAALVGRPSALQSRVREILKAGRTTRNGLQIHTVRWVISASLVFLSVGGVTLEPRSGIAGTSPSGPLRALGPGTRCDTTEWGWVRNVRLESSGMASVRIEGQSEEGLYMSKSQGVGLTCEEEGPGSVRISATGDGEAGSAVLLTVPSASNLSVRTASAGLTVRDIRGELDLESAGGDISLTNVTGGGRAEVTGPGAIDLTVEGTEWTATQLELKARSGAIYVFEPAEYRMKMKHRSDDGSPLVRVPDPDASTRVYEFPEAVGKSVTVTSREEPDS